MGEPELPPGEVGEDEPDRDEDAGRGEEELEVLAQGRPDSTQRGVKSLHRGTSSGWRDRRPASRIDRISYRGFS
jgi:hypothetical protein